MKLKRQVTARAKGCRSGVLLCLTSCLTGCGSIPTYDHEPDLLVGIDVHLGAGSWTNDERSRAVVLWRNFENFGPNSSWVEGPSTMIDAKRDPGARLELRTAPPSNAVLTEEYRSLLFDNTTQPSGEFALGLVAAFDDLGPSAGSTESFVLFANVETSTPSWLVADRVPKGYTVLGVDTTTSSLSVRESNGYAMEVVVDKDTPWHERFLCAGHTQGAPLPPPGQHSIAAAEYGVVCGHMVGPMCVNCTIRPIGPDPRGASAADACRIDLYERIAESDDSDRDGVVDPCDICPTDAGNDSDRDGVCALVDACRGNNSTGDDDGDQICNDLDDCLGDNANGDANSDGVCDSVAP